jgi:hypothetical protein
MSSRGEESGTIVSGVNVTALGPRALPCCDLAQREGAQPERRECNVNQRSIVPSVHATALGIKDLPGRIAPTIFALSPNIA